MADAPKEAPDEVPAGTGKSKLIPILLIANTVLVAGVLAFTLTRKAPAPAHAEAEDEKPAEAGHEAKAEHGGASEGHASKGPVGGGMGPTVRLENFVVQLRAVESERYAHLTIELEITSEDDKNRILQMLPRIRDTIIGYLADRTADELRGSEGMAKTKEAILDRITQIIPGRRVVNVYITDFIVQ